MGVAPAAPAAFGDDEILAGGHVHNDLIGFGIPNHGASGHVDDQRIAPLAAHFPAEAIEACLGGILALVTEVQQCGHVIVDMKNDTAAVTAVTTVRAAGGHIFLPVEGNGAVPSAASDDCDSNFIYKHIDSSFGVPPF